MLNLPLPYFFSQLNIPKMFYFACLYYILLFRNPNSSSIQFRPPQLTSVIPSPLPPFTSGDALHLQQGKQFNGNGRVFR